MSKYVDMREVAAKLSTVVIVGGSAGREDVLYVVCQDCQHIICHTEHGEAYGNELFEVILEHDCEDEIAQTLILEDDPLADTPELSDEDLAVVVPVNVPTLPQVTERLMVGLMAEICWELGDRQDAAQDTQKEQGETA